MTDQPDRSVEVFAELGCPFTHLGLLHFVQRRDAAGRNDIRLRVRAWPLEIINGKPLDPEFIHDEIEEICGQMDTDAFAGFDPASFPRTSMPAMALEALAYEHDLATGERVSLALRDLVFHSSADVADRDVLVDLARRHDLEIEIEHDALDDHRRLRADHAEGVERGVEGSPYFFTPAGGFFCPSLDIGRDDDGPLRVHTDPEGFDRFVDTCLA